MNLPLLTPTLLQRIPVGESVVGVERATVKNAGASVTSAVSRNSILKNRKFTTQTQFLMDPKAETMQKVLVVTRVS